MNKIIKAYKEVKRDYERYKKTDHPEYIKICKWLKENEHKKEFKEVRKKIVNKREAKYINPNQMELL